MMAFETNGGSVGGVDTSASPIRPHRVISIANESALDIEAGHYVSWQWDGGGYRTCNVKGRVLGLAGGNKDVDVMLVNEDGFINLKSGNSFKVYYESGRQAASSFDFNVDGSGKYVLVVSNAHSLFTPKTVQVQDVRATCVG